MDALYWLEKYDTRRFRRLQKHLRGIVHDTMEDYASYNGRTQECEVNFFAITPNWETVAPDHYEWYLTRYASTIVHEATHGYLESLGFAYTPENREQIERICHSEQMRFIRRVRSEYYDYAADMVYPFDASRWHEDWNMTRWQYARKLWGKLWAKDENSSQCNRAS
jgi:hypothetical protein